MNFFKCFAFFIFCSTSSIVYGQLTIKIISVPGTTLPEDKIYIAGTMNNWTPGLQAYELKKNSDGMYAITFTPAQGTVKFKFTRGSWDKVEGSSQGSFIPDRSTTYSGSPKTIELTIAGWEGLNPSVSTASAQVSILTDSFYMPPLNRYRKIWLYLPKDYATSGKAYPVLYMQDGQNLFDKKTSFAGEWGIDEALDSMYLRGDQGCIIVGIDHGGSNRLNEYSPWVNSQYGGGQGDEYIDFITQNLKPYIDQNYRTLSDAAHTGIMGSSMGGLIAFYAGMEHPDIFGRVGAFSSSFWFSAESYKQVSDNGVKAVSNIYMIAGQKEGGNQVGDMDKMYQALLNSGATDQQILKVSHNDGQHSEWYWRREFPKAYKWLFEKKTSETTEPVADDWKVFVSDRRAHFLGANIYPGDQVYVYDMGGNEILHGVLDESFSIDMSSLDVTSSMFIFRVAHRAKLMFVK